MSYDMTPKEARRELRRWFPVAVIATVMVTALGIIIAVMGSKAEFWISTQQAQNSAKNAQIGTKAVQNGVAFQDSEITVLQDRIADVVNVTIDMSGTSGTMYQDYSSERLADGNAACKAASFLTAIPSNEQTWVSSNCDLAAGQLAAMSPLYK